MLARVYSTNTRLKMSNFTSFILASISSLLSIWGFYFLIKKWSKFHISAIGKVLKVLYSLTLLLIITISIIIASLSFNKYWEGDRVRVITELQGVKLGWSKDEVYFRKGEPASVDIVKGEFTYLVYGAIRVGLKNDKVVKVIYVCQDDNYSYEKVGGISCDSDVDRVIKQYGESKDLKISEDKLSRFYNYPKYNLAFGLSKSKVEALAIFDSTKIHDSFRFSLWGYENSANKKTYSIEEVTGEPQEKYSRLVLVDEDLQSQEANPFDKYDAKEIQKLSRLDEIIVDVYGESALDHCAPDLKKAERLRRLALKGLTVRKTGYQTYSAGKYEIVFSSENVIRCR